MRFARDRLLTDTARSVRGRPHDGTRAAPSDRLGSAKGVCCAGFTNAHPAGGKTGVPPRVTRRESCFCHRHESPQNPLLIRDSRERNDPSVQRSGPDRPGPATGDLGRSLKGLLGRSSVGARASRTQQQVSDTLCCAGLPKTLQVVTSETKLSVGPRAGLRELPSHAPPPPIWDDRAGATSRARPGELDPAGHDRRLTNAVIRDTFRV